MNPYDDLGAPRSLCATGLCEWIEAKMGSMDPGPRRAWRGVVEALSRDPRLSRVWLLRSRSGGDVHPYDAALRMMAAAAPAARLVSASSGEPLMGEATLSAREVEARREGALRDLVALPALEAAPMYLEGVVAGRSPVKDDEGGVEV